MTNNKHKEIIEKTLDKICEGTSFIRGLPYDDEKLDYIGKCISSALTEQLEELDRWVEEEKVWITENGELAKQGHNKALNKVIDHIREQKEIINKK